MAENRISQHYKNKKNNKRGKSLFKPDLNEWREVCKLYCYDTQIIRHFDICKETFYRLIDRERYEKEQGRNSEYLDAYKEGRNGTKKQVLNKLLTSNEPAALIFSAKTFGGLSEKKDDRDYELKKKEFELKEKLFSFKQREFLTNLAEKFQLDFEQLKEFAEKFFKDAKVDEI